MKSKILILIISTLTLFSCQKVIDLEVTDSEPKLVIEANYDAIKEEVFVRISKSTNVFSANEPPMISGANIEIINSNGVASSLTDQGDGTYLLENYIPIYNSTYELKVDVEGELYEASDLLTPIVQLDSLTTEFQEPNAFSDGGYVVYMNFTDPTGPNFYRAIRQVNGEYKRDLGDQFLFDDGFSEGNTQKVPLFSEFYQDEDTVIVEFISYSEKSYTYFQELRAIAAGSASSAAPANPENTWSKEALGHFSVFGYHSDTLIIEE